MEFGGEEDRVHLLIDAHPAMDLATAIANQKPSSTTKYDWLQTILNNDALCQLSNNNIVKGYKQSNPQYPPSNQPSG
ncbi:hypothetical protein [Microcoleus sp. S13C4]|uniref:hypothetical protein n=1 Tax=Microcoleus sp. S13C4 TaxID=3055410 RepID=UPI002FD2FE65